MSRCEELAKTLPIATPDDANAERLEMAMQVTLKTAALHDRLDDADRMRGYGPWETSLYFPERPPGQAATEETIASVEAALAVLTPAALAELVDRHGLESGFEDLDIYAITHRTGLPLGTSYSTFMQTGAASTSRTSDRSSPRCCPQRHGATRTVRATRTRRRTSGGAWSMSTATCCRRSASCYGSA